VIASKAPSSKDEMRVMKVLNKIVKIISGDNSGSHEVLLTSLEIFGKIVV
jgi:hypothetical protein